MLKNFRDSVCKGNIKPVEMLYFFVALLAGDGCADWAYLIGLIKSSTLRLMVGIVIVLTSAYSIYKSLK